MDNKKRIIFASAALILIIVAIVGITFAAGTWTNLSEENKVSTGVVTFKYTEEENGLFITGANNMLDADGKVQNDYFDFSVSAEATGTIDVGYYIYVTKEVGSTLENDAVKIYLTQTSSENAAISEEQEVISPTLVSNLVPFDIDTLSYDPDSNNLLLATNKFTFDNTSGTATHYYRLRLWLDNDYSFEDNLTISDSEDNKSHTAILQSKTFKIKVSVYGANGDPKTITA